MDDDTFRRSNGWLKTKYSMIMLSGGVDSTSLGLHLLKQGAALRGIFVDFGQKSTQRQEAAARRFGLRWDFPIEIAPLSGMLNLFLPSLEPPHVMQMESATDLPVGIACDDSMMAISIAGVYASHVGANVLYYGATREDLERTAKLPKMLKHIESAIRLMSGNKSFSIKIPFADKSHLEVAKVLHRIDKGMAAATWSCHWGGFYHCGSCYGCANRKRRFSDAGITDPTKYSTEHP